MSACFSCLFGNCDNTVMVNRCEFTVAYALVTIAEQSVYCAAYHVNGKLGSFCRVCGFVVCKLQCVKSAVNSLRVAEVLFVGHVVIVILIKECLCALKNYG